MNDYDIYLRHDDIQGGSWVGFMLAWKGLAGVHGLPERPHRRRYPWFMDPTRPEEPHEGHWGLLQWYMEVALLDGMTGLQGTPPLDGRTAADMRADLGQFRILTSLELKDVDGSTHTVRMIAYTEHALEPYDTPHPNGGSIAQIEFVKP